MRRTAEPLGAITCLLKHNSILFLSLSPHWFCKGNASDELIFTLPRTRPAIIHWPRVHAVHVTPHFSIALCFSRWGYGGRTRCVGWPRGSVQHVYWHFEDEDGVMKVLPWWRRRGNGGRHIMIEFTPSPLISVGGPVSNILARRHAASCHWKRPVPCPPVNFNQHSMAGGWGLMPTRDAYLEKKFWQIADSP